MIGITREGAWLGYGGSIEDIRQDRWHIHPSCRPSFLSPSREVQGLVELVGTEFRVTPVDVVFPVLHGKYGEDGTLQGLLELSGIPFVGCGMLSSALCMDKELAHQLVQAAGIGTPSSFTMNKNEDIEARLSEAQALGFPLFVKPARSGSSLGITKVNNMEELAAGIETAFGHDNKVVIEENIDGFEVGCAVLGNSDPLIGVVDEIELQGSFLIMPRSIRWPIPRSTCLPALMRKRRTGSRRRHDRFIEYWAVEDWRGWICSWLTTEELCLTKSIRYRASHRAPATQVCSKPAGYPIPIFLTSCWSSPLPRTGNDG